jgi:PAS domain S-box-containing protein
VRPTLTKKIGLLLLLPFLGSLAGALVFASYLQRTRTSDHVVNVAGRQRMLSAELRDWAHMVSIGQEEDRTGLRSRVEEFEHALVALQRGGRVLEGVVDAVPAELQPELAAVASLWNQLRPDLLTVAEASRGEARFVAAYQRVEQRLPQLRDLAHRFVTAFVARRQRQQRQILRTLGLIAAANFAVFLVGLFLTRRYIVRPVLGVETAARRIQAGDFSVRLDVSTHDEMGTLARTFNRMTEHVQRLLDALDLRRKHAETIVNSVPAWLLALRKDLTVLRVNRSFREAFGLDEGAVAGKDLTALLPVPGLREAVLEVLSSGEPKRGLHLEMPWKDRKRSLRVTIAGTRLAEEEEEEEEEEALVVVEDLTEEEHLAARTHLLALALESVADPVVITDTAGAIQYVNDAFGRQNGYDVADVRGKNPRILKSGQTDPAVHAALWQALTAGRAFSGTVVNRRKDGSTYEAILTVAPVHDASGTVRHYVSTHRDVTERRQAEEALRRSEAELRALVDRAVFGIYRSTPEGRLLMANQALVETLGYGSPEELLALDMSTALYQQPEQRRRLLELYAGQEDFRGVEVGWKRKDGTPITVRLSGRPVRGPGGVVAALEVFVEDVTERLALEDQLRQSQKMQAVGELAGGMAHDFNNLLTTILANSELMAGELPPDSALAEEVASIRQAALRGAELTGKLLGFSRRQHLDLQPVDLGALVTDFGRMMRRVLSEDIRMRVIVEEAGLGAQADPGAVDQVLMNLVTNARDAMLPGGTLLVQARRAVLDEAYCEARGWGRAGEYIAIEVSDTGVGMDEQTKQRIFEPFFTTKPAGAGTGLGMAMVYGLVKQHRGYVDVYTEVGRGTTIRVFLPASAEASERPAAAAAPVLRGGTETILLVEDEEALRRTTKRVLERHGYTVLTAADGAEALDAFQAHRAEIALVLSDVVMPRMGGPELLRKLQAAGHRVRFLFTSGYTAPDVEATAKIPSGTPFVSKPWNIADLLSRVRRVLDVPL